MGIKKVAAKRENNDHSNRAFILYEDDAGDKGQVGLIIQGCEFTTSSKDSSGVPRIDITIPRNMALAMGLFSMPQPKT